MTTFDEVSTWVGRIWAGVLLLIVLLIVLGAAAGRIYDARERRAARRRDVATVHHLADRQRAR